MLGLAGRARIPGNPRSPHGGVIRLRVENADRDQHFFVYDPHGFCQIGVIRNDHQLIAVIPECIDQHVCGDVYLRAFFFHLEHVREAGAARTWGGKRHRYRALQIVAVMHRQIRQRLQGANVDFLAKPRMRIADLSF
jgi:hypothetical protein